MKCFCILLDRGKPGLADAGIFPDGLEESIIQLASLLLYAGYMCKEE